jgi:hypothetical protein
MSKMDMLISQISSTSGYAGHSTVFTQTSSAESSLQKVRNSLRTLIGMVEKSMRRLSFLRA